MTFGCRPINCWQEGEEEFLSFYMALGRQDFVYYFAFAIFGIGFIIATEI